MLLSSDIIREGVVCSESRTERDFFFFSSRRRHTRYWRDWSSDVCSSDLPVTDDVSAYHFCNHGLTGKWKLAVTQIKERKHKSYLPVEL